VCRRRERVVERASRTIANCVIAQDGELLLFAQLGEGESVQPAEHGAEEAESPRWPAP